jgi:5-methylcytosine-specific restriction protein A
MEIWMSEALADLSRALGLDLIDSPVPDGSGFTFGLRLRDLPAPSGFEIRVQQSLMSTKAQLILDNFPGDLLLTCKSAFGLYEDQIASILASAKSSGLSVDFLVDGNSDFGNFSNLNWESLSLTLHKKFENYTDASNGLKLTVLMAFSILIPLITEEPEQLLEEISNDYREEGRKSSVTVNKYERSRVNRAIALEIHGFICQGCDLRMADLYGPIGEGVIHVHHLEPVSLMDAPRVLNPATDLAPLCPNCHAIVHKRNPPLDISELKMTLTR